MSSASAAAQDAQAASMVIPQAASLLRRKPLVSLGLPVYNGSNFLRAALESVLAQTFRDWELILSDNGSTDSTQSICREFAARDARIRYLREESNRGATWNFNRVFALARGPLFRWTAHDDVCAPELLERCVSVLAARPDVVLCHSRTRVIGVQGEPLGDYAILLRTDSSEIGHRFYDLICRDHACFPIFGVVRTEALRRTKLLGDFVGADRNLLAELALHGPFHEIPEFLFMRRDHPGTSTRQFPSARERLVWFRAGEARSRFPTLRRARGYLMSIARTPLEPAARLACLGILGKWGWLRLRAALNRNLHGFGLETWFTVPEPRPHAASQTSLSPPTSLPMASSLSLPG